MKELLSREGHAYTERNVEDDAAAYDDLIVLGFRTIPVTLIGGRAIKGFDEPALRAALACAAGS